MSGFADFLQEQRDYRRAFLAREPVPPWRCHFCGGPVELEGKLRAAYLVVHHVDHDRSNSAAANLAPAHHVCHTTYHHLERAASGTNPFQDPEVGRMGGAAFSERLRTDPAFAAAHSAKSRKGGRRGRAVFLERLRTDPDFAAAFAAKAREAGRKGGRIGGKRGRAKGARVANALRYRCLECGMVTSPGPLGTHQKATGHSGRTRVA